MVRCGYTPTTFKEWTPHPDHLTIVGENLVMLIDDPTYGGQLVMLGEDSLDILWDHSDSDFEQNSGEIWADDHWLYLVADDANSA